MTLDTMADRQSLRPRRPWVETLLLLGFLLFLLLGIAAFAAFFLMSRAAPQPDMTAPLQALQPERIAPELALQQLAGDAPAALAYQALNAGELANAYAIMAFDTQSDGPARAGLYGQLARRFQDQGAEGEAGITFNVVRALAVLDPSLSAQERSQQLTRAAEGFAALDAPDAALDVAQQAMLVGAKAPDLLPAQRQQIFQGLTPLATTLDSDLFSQQLNDLIRNPFLAPTGVLITPQMQALAEAMPYDQPLLDAIATRQLAARQLAERIRFTGGADIGPEQQALSAALLREDGIRRSYYEQMRALPASLPQQLWLLLDERAWLALKTRIALQGFGLNLVPEWESSVNALQQELAQQAGAVDLAVKAVARMQSDPVSQAMLEVEGLQWLALQAELGLYAGAPRQDISDRLQAAQQRLSQTGAASALPVYFGESAVPPGFRIQP